MSFEIKKTSLLSVMTNRVTGGDMTTPSLVSFQGPTNDSRCFHIMSKMHKSVTGYSKSHELVTENWEGMTSLT